MKLAHPNLPPQCLATALGTDLCTEVYRTRSLSCGNLEGSGGKLGGLAMRSRFLRSAVGFGDVVLREALELELESLISVLGGLISI